MKSLFLHKISSMLLRLQEGSRCVPQSATRRLNRTKQKWLKKSNYKKLKYLNASLTSSRSRWSFLNKQQRSILTRWETQWKSTMNLTNSSKLMHRFKKGSLSSKLLRNNRIRLVILMLQDQTSNTPSAKEIHLPMRSVMMPWTNLRLCFPRLWNLLTWLSRRILMSGVKQTLVTMVRQ